MPLVDDRARLAGEEARDLFDRPLRGRKADALQRTAADMLEPLEREREMRSAARLQHGMDLIDDDDARRLEHLPGALGREQQVERFRRRHQDVRRRAQHGGAIRLRRVAAPHCGGDLDLRCERMDLAARLRQVLVDVGGERLERRNVDDANFVGQPAMLQAFAQQLVDCGEEGGERLARAGRCRDERILATTDSTPAFKLRFGRFGKAAGPPFAQDRMKIEG